MQHPKCRTCGERHRLGPCPEGGEELTREELRRRQEEGRAARRAELEASRPEPRRTVARLLDEMKVVKAAGRPVVMEAKEDKLDKEDKRDRRVLATKEEAERRERVEKIREEKVREIFGEGLGSPVQEPTPVKPKVSKGVFDRVAYQREYMRRRRVARRAAGICPECGQRLPCWRSGTDAAKGGG